MHQNHPEGLLKDTLLGPTPRFFKFRKSEEEPVNLHSKNFANAAETAGLRTLRTSGLYYFY